MEDILLPDIDFKLYKERAIFIGTYLGGPLAAGYFLTENFKKLNKPEKVKPTWIIAVCAAILIFAVLFLIPNIDKIPNVVIPLSYALITQAIVKKYQGADIKSHIDNGGVAYSAWRAVWIGILVGLITFAILMAVAVLMFKNESQ